MTSSRAPARELPRSRASTNGRAPRPHPLGGLAAAVALFCLVPRVTIGAPCPAATLSGSDPALLAEVRRLLEPHHVNTATTAARECVPLEVAVEPVPEGVRLAVAGPVGDRSDRVVSSPATAASLVVSWTAPALSGLSWLDPSAVEPSLTATVSPPTEALLAVGPGGMRLDGPPGVPTEPPAGPRAPVAAALEAPRPAVETEAEVVAAGPSARWWAGASAIASEAASYGAELEVARVSHVGPVLLSPAARVALELQPDRDLISGARVTAASLGAHLGWRALIGRSGLVPAVAVFAQWRHVMPSQSVGVIPCGPAAPCSVDTIIAGPASAYEGLTVWTEGSVAIEVPLSEGVDVRVALAFGGTPGHIVIGAPPLPTEVDPRDRVRDRPRLPRWAGRAQLAVQWEGP